MHKYGGILIHQSHDDDGFLEVVEQDGVRSLHFGSSSIQSAMHLANPDDLSLAYVRTMTSWLLFQEGLVGETLLVGLGGGSIAKHLLQHFPDCQITAVEARRSVAKIARSHFGLPLDPRLKIIIGDGNRYVRRHADSEPGRFGLLVVDAFDHEGIAESIKSQAFFDACQALLAANGLLVINLWGGLSNPDFQAAALWLGRAFGWKVLLLPVIGRGNIIGLAFNSKPRHLTLKTLTQRAKLLEQQLNIEFPVFLQELKKHNPNSLKELLKP